MSNTIVKKEHAPIHMTLSNPAFQARPGPGWAAGPTRAKREADRGPTARKPTAHWQTAKRCRVKKRPFSRVITPSSLVFTGFHFGVSFSVPLTVPPPVFLKVFLFASFFLYLHTSLPR